MVFENIIQWNFLNKPIGKLFRFTGLIAATLFYIISLLSIHYNSWFIFTEHAFSDLGGPEAQKPGIYNWGMIALGVLILLYSFTLIQDATNKAETIGGAFIFIAGIFLALIGIYPSGTQPHSFVSSWFFTQAELAMLAWGIGLMLNDWKNFGKVILILGIFGPIGAAVIQWPSVASIEAYGIVIIDIWVVLLLKVQATRLTSHSTT
ncbi:MAG: DUF998 domain-containing protein [Candidatus Heimdallarchaeota archaeon]